MVYLTDLKTQWPWNPNAVEDLSDKEIYTHLVHVEDASAEWRVPVLEPMNGFAYTGVRVSVYGKQPDYTMLSNLVIGATRKPMFGLPYDRSVCSNASWTPLGYPLTHKMIAIGEDGLDLLIPHESACWGRVDFIAQRFDDIREDEEGMSYAFLNPRTDKVEWILDQTNRMWKPRILEEPVYIPACQVIPSILRLLDLQRNGWPAEALLPPRLNIPAPLL
jgi:hypothetical protein